MPKDERTQEKILYEIPCCHNVTKETFGVRAGQCTSGVGSKSNIANPYSKLHEVMKQEPGEADLGGKRAKNPCQ